MLTLIFAKKIWQGNIDTMRKEFRLKKKNRSKLCTNEKKLKQKRKRNKLVQNWAKLKANLSSTGLTTG